MGQPRWGQAVIEFAGPAAAETTAGRHLRPALARAQADGMISRWFFIRKSPGWRLRYQPPGPAAGDMLDALAAAGRIAGWTAGIYEPETLAFGGDAAMDTAHDLFCADSRHILDHLTPAPGRPPGLGRRELAVLLPSVLMRAAGQDWYEQGDIWAQVARHRAGGSHLPPARARELQAAVRTLMTVDAGPGTALTTTGPLAPIAAWTAAFDHAGQDLGRHAARGTLERGLRAVLAHHVIFHWNRLGLPYAQQHTLAGLAAETVMDGEHAPDQPRD